MSTKMFQEDFDFSSEITNMSISEDSLPLTTKEDFFMMVEDIRPYAGFGTYVIGNVISGGISEGDEVEYISSESTKKAKIKHIKVRNSLVNSALAGTVCYILLEDGFYRNVNVGDYICFPGSFKKCNGFEAYIYIFNKEKKSNKKIELSNGNILSFNINKSKFDGKIELLEELAVIPNGVSVKIKVTMDKPVFIKTTYESIKVNHLENEYVGFGVISKL